MSQLAAATILARSSLTAFERPDRLPRALAAMAPWGGVTLAAVVAAAAGRYPDRIAVHDEDGPTTYRELWAASRRLAGALAARGVGKGSVVGLLGRNHVGFVTWLVGASATGADVVLLNTGFAGPQAADVVEHEGIDLIIHDADFADVAAACQADLVDESEAAVLARSGTPLRSQRVQGRLVILTSGTTGRPKGAARRAGGDLSGAAAVLDRIPFRVGDVQVVPSPLFHAWGLTNLMFGIGRCATTVLARRFDPEQTLRAVSEHRADVLVVVPVMLARILALPADVLVDNQTPELRIVASSGSALGGTLASAVLDRFGPVLYNLYGSTEVAVATIAAPDDLKRAPNTAGRVAFGVRVEILDEDGKPVPGGSVGRIFVGGSMRFEGYTGGGGKEEQRGLLSSGDLGHFEGDLLFVDGREDDMIVSGGENVFPSEVEDLLNVHPEVADAAVVGVADDEFGQVLAAFVVTVSDAELDVDGVRDHVRIHLARHKVPRHVRFVDELPRNPTGKLLRRSMIADVEGGDEASGS